ncbi:hypothetical protein [Mycobacterium sp. 23]|uniref:hypothetical protein n=1 Tax=Mycobacterium sp. 23 TaxID=3400424 RepID=UPI003AAB5003
MPEQSTDLKSIMRSHQLTVDICNDPDLDGDAKLFALLVVTLLYQRRAAGRKDLKSRSMFQQIAKMCNKRDPNFWIRRVIQKDIPSYEPPHRSEQGCLAPMIQREGPCGKPAIAHGWDRDPLTGAATPYAFCSRHRNHADDWRIKQNIKQWIDNGRPSPPPNSGGVLRRYFAADWDALYKWAAPYLTPLDGEKPPTLPKPNLSLIRGGSA